MKNYHIFANHAHVFPEEAKPGCGIDSLKALMDECSIERAVCFAPFPSQYEDYNMPGDCISWLADAIKGDESLVGFGTVDFDSGDIKALKKAGLYGAICGRSIYKGTLDLREALEICRE